MTGKSLSGVSGVYRMVRKYRCEVALKTAAKGSPVLLG